MVRLMRKRLHGVPKKRRPGETLGRHVYHPWATPHPSSIHHHPLSSIHAISLNCWTLLKSYLGAAVHCDRKAAMDAIEKDSNYSLHLHIWNKIFVPAPVFLLSNQLRRAWFCWSLGLFTWLKLQCCNANNALSPFPSMGECNSANMYRQKIYQTFHLPF